MHAKVKTRIKITPIALTILKAIAVAGIVVTVVTLPGMATLIAPFLKKKQYTPRQALRKNVQSLVTHGLIRTRSVRRGDTVFEITKRGKWELLIRRDHAVQTDKKWNGIWHVVIFDIPSTRERKVRSELHRAMKLYGFQMVQKSVWAYPYACEEFLRSLKSYLGVTRDILYMRTNYIEHDIHLRREFGL